MLQPKTYPELLGKALVLEAEPFTTLADDDNPWMEGLFFVICLGVLVGMAQFLGGILLTASLPPNEALREGAIILGRQALAASSAPTLDLESAEATLRQIWSWAAFMTGYGGGWSRLLLVIAVPALLTVIWLAYGGVSFIAARWLGGSGTLNQTLGVTALVFAPLVLMVLTVIPFVAIGWLLPAMWALLIGFRGLEVAHDLSWERSVLAALAGPIMLTLLGIAGLVVVGAMAWIGGVA